jgi:hypothetical protein
LNDSYVYLATGRDDTVWFVRPGKPPCDSGSSCEQFHKHSELLNEPRIRIVGVARNFQLIHRCLDLRQREIIGSIQVCSPLAGSTRAEREDTGRQLAAAERWRVPVSVGGWYEVGACLAATLSIWASRREGVDAFDQAIRCHPLWPALSFIDGLDRFAAADVLVAIADPRWHTDRRHPDRLSKMYSQLQLSPAGLRANLGVLQSPDKFDPHTVVRAVRSNPIAKIESADKVPGQFLDRYWENVLSVRDDELIANLRVAQLFIRYLRSTWLEVADEVRKPEGDRLFSPRDFFREEAESRAWETHMASFDCDD